MPSSCGVAHLYEVLEHEEAFYIITEKAEGVDLFEMLAQEGSFPLEASKEIIFQLLEAVAHLHDNKCVHKERMPGNGVQ